MIKLFWKLVQFISDNICYIDLASYQGYRKFIGGRWGLWESDAFGKPYFKIWVPSACEHYPTPFCVTSTEPLQTEEWQ